MPDTVPAEHADDTDPYEKPLAKRIEQADTVQDLRVVELAQRLMRLMDADGARTGRYTVDVRDVQIGDRNTQTNALITP